MREKWQKAILLAINDTHFIKTFVIWLWRIWGISCEPWAGYCNQWYRERRADKAVTNTPQLQAWVLAEFLRPFGCKRWLLAGKEYFSPDSCGQYIPQETFPSVLIFVRGFPDFKRPTQFINVDRNLNPIFFLTVGVVKNSNSEVVSKIGQMLLPFFLPCFERTPKDDSLHVDKPARHGKDLIFAWFWWYYNPLLDGKERNSATNIFPHLQFLSDELWQC